MKKHKRNSQRGFTTLQLAITIAIAVVVATFAYVGIVRARAHLHLTSSARQFAMLVERARADSVRRHANGSERAMIHQVNETTYAVTMDFQGNGSITTQNIKTEKGITLLMPFDLVFDWRGRIFSEAQVTFDNPTYGYRTWVGITGSGDVTMEADYFFDASLPTPPLNGGEGGSVIADPSPTPNGGSSPTPTPTPTPTPDPNASPTPTPSATATPLPTATPISTPTPTPTPYPSPTPTPTPVPCTITSSPTAITIGQNAAGTVNVSLVNFVGTGTIIAESSNSGQILVTPTSATVSGSAPKTFTIQVKKTSGSVTFSSVCGSSKTVTVTVR